MISNHDDAIKWKHFPRYRPFVRANSPVISFICAWRNDFVNSRDTGDLGRRRAQYNVVVM